MELKISNQKENHQAAVQACCLWASVWTEHLIKRKKLQMGGDGKENVFSSWPSTIWLCQKKRGGNNNLKYVTFFLFLPSCLPFASNNAAVPWATVLLGCAVAGGRVGGGGHGGAAQCCVLTSCRLLLLRFENYWYRECVFISSPPPLSRGKKKPVKNEHLAENPSGLKEEVSWIYDLPFLLKYKLETSWEQNLLLSYAGVRGGWAVAGAGVAAWARKTFLISWVAACWPAWVVVFSLLIWFCERTVRAS